MSEDLKAAWERAESAEHRLKQLETSLRRLMRLLRPRPQDPDRKLIGWRIVRNHPETGEREWRGRGYWLDSPSNARQYMVDELAHVRRMARINKSRVVAVYHRVVRRA